MPAIDAARKLASELGLAERARFIQADLYDAPAAIPEAAAFDMVFVTWGAIVWLPDIFRWAEIVCHFLKPGGSLYLAEAHPVAMVFDDAARLPDGRPGFFAPYLSREVVVMEEAHDYIDETTRVATRQHILGYTTGGYHLRPSEGGHAHRLAPRTRRGRLAYVRFAGAKRGWALAMAR